jgi:hypothetical protein
MKIAELGSNLHAMETIYNGSTEVFWSGTEWS